MGQNALYTSHHPIIGFDDRCNRSLGIPVAVAPAAVIRARMRESAAADAFHRIEVRLSPESRLAHPDSTVRTRIGYYSEP